MKLKRPPSVTKPQPWVPDQRRPRRAAMTLIELLVVIAIVAALIALGVITWRSAKRANEEATMRINLKQIMAAHAEYRAQAGQPVIYNSNGSKGKNVSISFFISQIVQIPEAKAILLTVNKSRWSEIGKNSSSVRFFDFDGNPAGNVPAGVPGLLEDPWGEPLQYRSHQLQNVAAYSGAGNLPARGTAATPGVPAHPQPFVASAGPDGVFNTEDDIFSFETE